MSTSHRGHIFISYRRTDSAGYAGRIFDRLTAHFGEDAVFMDVATIDAGVDFVEVLQSAVRSCDVLVVLIGRQWHSMTDETGKRRLDNPEDFVRVEVAAALSRDIRVIPVLVDGAPMPRSAELPDNLMSLARRNALQVNHPSFHADVNHLISQLDLALKASEEIRKQERKRKAAPAKPKDRAESLPYKPSVGRVSSTKGTKTGKSAWLNYNFVRGVIVLAVATLLVISAFILNAIIPSDILRPQIQPNTTLQELRVGSTMISEKDGMVMIYVPAGDFPMGSENGGKGEKPVHTVYLDAFWIDQTEVTNAMYAKCVQARECNQPSDDTYYNDSSYTNHPVVFVSWNDAIVYCSWAERRLPSEAEWEKAASWNPSTGEKFVYPWGNNFDCTRGNLQGPNCSVPARTSVVGSFSNGGSPYGVLDMSGNVWEWIEDWYSNEYYGSSPSSNPKGPDTGTFRVLRGGSWTYSYLNARTATRFWGDPSATKVNYGFRCTSSSP